MSLKPFSLDLIRDYKVSKNGRHYYQDVNTKHIEWVGKYPYKKTCNVVLKNGDVQKREIRI